MEAGYAVLWALTVTMLLAGANAGATYKPEGLTVPYVELPPGISLTVQVTVLGEIGTYAVYCREVPVSMEEDSG
jgi:hypothetical protein